MSDWERLLKTLAKDRSPETHKYLIQLRYTHNDHSFDEHYVVSEIKDKIPKWSNFLPKPGSWYTVTDLGPDGSSTQGYSSPSYSS